MASGTLPPPPVAPPPRPSRSSKHALPAEFIDEQIGKTRAYVKSVDIAHGVLVLVTGFVAYLLAMALVDHWLAPGGLGVVGRSIAFVAFVGGAVWHVLRSIVPLVMLRINPLYAAQTIEHVQPSFKNSLLSLLQLRQQRSEVPDAVYASVEQHAASRLAEVPVETTVDRGPLVRIGYVMLGVVIAACLYYLISPKDALQSAGRVLMPWSDIAAPTRVTIADVQPGDTTVVRGQQVEVSAAIDGLRDDETARVVYSSEDGQIVDRELPMLLPEGAYRHVAILPPGDERLQGSVSYRIEAGDARSPTYQIVVEPTPAIEVESIEYDYPDYTAPILQDRRVDGGGDIRAVEGTQVTIRCRANQPIGRASIDFGCDGKTDYTMRVRDDRAVYQFVLEFADRANLVPKHASYQIKFYNRQGRDNPTPVQHAIEVLPDLPPEVSLDRPAETHIEVPEDEAVDFRATARDADFMLSEVLFSHEGRAGQREAVSVALLAAEKAPWRGKFDAQWRKTPRELGYRAGDVIRYWVEAVDNKLPIDAANRASTRPATIRVLAPLRPEEQPKPKDQPDDKQPQDDQPQQDQPKDDNPQPQDKPKDGDKQDENPRDDEQDQPKDDNTADTADKQPGEKGDAPKDDKGDKGKPGEKGATDKPEQGDQGGKNDTPKGEQQQDPKDGAGGTPQDGNAGGENQPSTGDNDGGKKGEQKGSADGSGGENTGERSDTPGGGDSPSDRPQRQGPADDAEAVRELLKDRQQQQGDKPGDGAADKAEPGAGDKPKNATTDQAPSGDEPPQDATPGAKDSPAKDEEKTDDPTGAGGPQQEDDPNGAAKPKDDGTNGEGMGDESKDAQQDKSGTPGGEAKSTSPKDDGKPAQESDSTPGPGKGRATDDGAGKPSEDKHGAPEHQGTLKPQPDVDDQSDNAKPSDNDVKSPSIDEKESQKPTKGEQGGDRSQGGEAGGGGSTPNAGKDTPGGTTESDEGANTAKTPGKGETGDKAGDQVEAEDKTGSSKPKPGKGSAGDARDGDQPKQPTDGTPGKGDSPASNDSQQDDNARKGASGKNPGQGRLDPGGGRAPGNTNDNAPPPEQAAGPEVEDPADLDYAKKATDLALEHLRDRMKQGDDQQLLDKLGWTREDAERFLANWDQIKRDAATSGGPAEQRLHEELKSLGLRRGGTQFTEGQATKDAQRDLSQGANIPTPAEFRERQRAYRVGTANGPQRGE